MLGDYQFNCCNGDCEQGRNCPVRIKPLCDRLLEALLPNQPELCERWWKSPNRAFTDLEPIVALDRDPRFVLQYLRNQISGDYL
jgi:hypothetical protein